MDELAAEYLSKVEIDVHEMLCNQNADAANYQGLDINHDTVEEVKTIVQLFPDTLSKKEKKLDGAPMKTEKKVYGLPLMREKVIIRFSVCCLRLEPTVIVVISRLRPFIVTLAQLGMESNQFR